MADIEIPNLASTGGQVDLNTLTGVLTEIAEVVNDAVGDDGLIDGGPA